MKGEIILAATLFMSACTTEQRVESYTIPYEQYTLDDHTPITLGGYGSSVAYSVEEDLIYMLTDRGPNIDGIIPKSKVFLMPKYSPTIGVFRIENGQLKLLYKIILKESDGTPFLGLPNRTKETTNTEVAYDIFDNKLETTFRGLDSEGLTLAPDGTFWVSDEYTPLVLNFFRDGLLLREFSPSDILPAHYSRRRPNCGMEGITISPDGKRLYGIMQMPLYIPDNNTKDRTRNNRIVEIDITTGMTRDLIYQMESPLHLVSDISESSNITNCVIEILDDAALKRKGFNPVKKSLVVDILETIPTYPHDKAEGIALRDKNTLILVNDDDFGVSQSKAGATQQK